MITKINDTTLHKQRLCYPHSLKQQTRVFTSLQILHNSNKNRLKAVLITLSLLLIFFCLASLVSPAGNNNFQGFPFVLKHI